MFNRNWPHGPKAAAQTAASRMHPDTPATTPGGNGGEQKNTIRLKVWRKWNQESTHLTVTSSVRCHRITKHEQQPGSQSTAAGGGRDRYRPAKEFRYSIRAQRRRLPVSREQVESGWLTLRLSEHDGERLHDQSAQAGARDGVRVKRVSKTISTDRSGGTKWTIECEVWIIFKVLNLFFEYLALMLPSKMQKQVLHVNENGFCRADSRLVWNQNVVS